jgi:hypothetical protein
MRGWSSGRSYSAALVGVWGCMVDMGSSVRRGGLIVPVLW